MSNHIGQCLLGDAVRRHLDGGRQLGTLVGQVESDGQSRSVRQLPPELGPELMDRFGEAINLQME